MKNGENKQMTFLMGFTVHGSVNNFPVWYGQFRSRFEKPDLIEKTALDPQKEAEIKELESLQFTNRLSRHWEPISRHWNLIGNGLSEKLTADDRRMIGEDKINNATGSNAYYWLKLKKRNLSP
jgi:hypothetical protein